MLEVGGHGEGIITNLHFLAHQGGLPTLIAGSVGPYGACQHDMSEYSGSYVDHMTERVCHMTECVCIGMSHDCMNVNHMTECVLCFVCYRTSHCQEQGAFVVYAVIHTC